MWRPSIPSKQLLISEHYEDRKWNFWLAPGQHCHQKFHKHYSWRVTPGKSHFKHHTKKNANFVEYCCCMCKYCKLMWYLVSILSVGAVEPGICETHCLCNISSSGENWGGCIDLKNSLVYIEMLYIYWKYIYWNTIYMSMFLYWECIHCHRVSIRMN